MKENEVHSSKYKNWLATLDLKTCAECRQKHGKIYIDGEEVSPKPPLHLNCRCQIKWLRARYAGTATQKGVDGADWWLKWVGSLPNYYITKEEAEKRGYVPVLGNLSAVAPGKMLTEGVYKNKNSHLPQAPGRVWKEADINYFSGYRGAERVVFSNDGLVFVTYDHYKTFQIII